MFKLIFSGASVVAIAASVFSATASATPVCFDPFSQGGSTPTIGPVCGNIQIQGGFNGGNFSVTQDPTPQGSNTSVSLNGAGGGTGLGALTSVSGSFGVGHIKSTDFDTNPQNLSDESSVTATGQLGVMDQFTVVGTTNLQALFTSSLSGSFSGNGTGESILRVINLTTGSFVISQLEAIVAQTFPTTTVTSTVTLLAGDTYLFDWSMEATAASRVDFLTDNPNSSADLSDTGHLNIDVLTPGGSLNFLSGTDYSSNAVSTTPLPATLPLFAGGLGFVGYLAKRRKKNATPAVAAA